ncbi:MAG: hypothetical protein J6W10_02185 [Kiritimatiellae bacterium]|nr:hypothetical protein [Kiritimatiellia bacterium]
MKETLNRINELYLNNAKSYYNDFDHAVYMFLNIAYMRETQRNASPVAFPTDEVGKLLAEAVEAAILAYEGTEFECVKREVDVDEVRQKAKTLYATAKKCADFNDVVNSHFRAAAENVIGLGVTRKEIYITDASEGSCRNVYKAFRAICKSWK